MPRSPKTRITKNRKAKKVKLVEVKVHPFLKWAGGKLRVLPELKKRFTEGMRFVEPFLGAGSVSLNVDYPTYLVNDFNPDLIAVWSSLKEQKGRFIDACQNLFVPENNTEESYNRLRTEFNSTRNQFRKASLFVYLNRHGFNGLCRYSGNGYNVPVGKYKNPVFFPREDMLVCANKLDNFEVHNRDFREIFDMVREGDVVYCDPPYVPLTATSNFKNYTAEGFGLKEQIDLATCARVAADSGATVVVSNHYNWYTDQIYNQMGGAKLYKIQVSRTISSDTENRSPVVEVIAVFTKKNT